MQKKAVIFSAGEYLNSSSIQNLNWIYRVLSMIYYLYDDDGFCGYLWYDLKRTKLEGDYGNCK